MWCSKSGADGRQWHATPPNRWNEEHDDDEEVDAKSDNNNKKKNINKIAAEDTQKTHKKNKNQQKY